MTAKEAAERRTRVLALRVAGLADDAIASQLGISVATVRRDVSRALNASTATADVGLEMERLEAMERATWAVLRRPRKTPDDETALKAVETLLRIHEQRGRSQLLADAVAEAREAAAEWEEAAGAAD